MMKIAEYKKIGGKMKLVTREMTAEEISVTPEPAKAEEPADLLKDMVTAISTATTLAQIRNAAKTFLKNS